MAAAVGSACATLAILPPAARGTDGTWIGGDSYAATALRFAPNGGPAELPDPVVFWSETRNWSDGWTFPGDGGAATLGLPLPAGDVDRLAQVKVLMDVSTSLSLLRFDNPRGVALLDNFPSSGAFLWAVPGGLTVESQRARPEPASRATAPLAGNSIQIPVEGPNDLVVRGPGVLSLTRANGFTGDLRLIGDAAGGAGGVLAITEQAGNELSDARFGLGRRISMEGGTLRLQRGSGSTPRVLSRPVDVGPAGGTISLHGGAAGVAWTGPAGGAGTLRLDRGRLDLRADNPLGGAVRVDAGAALVVSGRLASAGSIVAAGTVELRHAAGSPFADRVSDAAAVVLRGGALSLENDAAGAYEETIGRVTLLDGAATVSSAPSTTLRLEAVTRERGGGALFRGDDLGAPAAAPRILLGNGTSLLVGGGPAGTTRVGVIPWAWGVGGPSDASHTGAGTGSFVTYDGARGVRPLDLGTEYAPSLATAAADENVRASASQNLSGPGRRINALLLSPADGTPGGPAPTLVGGTIAIGSGAILNTAVGSAVFNPIDFGEREGIVMAASTPQAAPGSNRGLALWGAIAGSGGLTRIGHGNVFLGGASTYTGPTTLAGGRTGIADHVLPGVPGPFGRSSEPITLLAGGVSAGGTVATMLLAERVGEPLVIARPVRVDGMTSAAAGAGSATSGGVLVGGVVNGSSLVFAGPVDLVSRDAALGAFAGHVRFDGPVSGPGGLRVLGGATVTVSRSNSQWTGEVEIGVDGAASTIHVEADQALGAGRLYIAGRSTIAGAAAGGAPHRIENPVAFAWSESTAGGPVAAATFAGGLVLAGAIDLGGNVGRVISLADDAAVTLAGPAGGGSFRLVASATSGPGGTLTLAGANAFDARVILGAPESSLSIGGPALPGGVLRIAHPAALGAAGAQIDADGSTIQVDAAGALGVQVVGGGNLFLRGSGAAGGMLGALNNAVGDNAIDGGISLLSDAVIRVEAATRLRVGGALADQSVPSAQPPAAVLSKTGGGTLVVPRLARSDLKTGDYVPAAGAALAEVRIEAGDLAIADLPGINRPDQVSVVQRLFVAPGARLDLNRASLIVDYEPASPSPLPQMRGLVASGRGSGGGAWNGPGIGSAAAGADPRAALAVLESSDLPGAPAAFLGRPIDGSAVVVTYALVGDADLTGTVGLADFARLATAFNETGTWTNGDFDYDEIVGIGDFASLAFNFNVSINSLARPGSAVPEPSAAALAGAALLVRRRQHPPARPKPAGF